MSRYEKGKYLLLAAAFVCLAAASRIYSENTDISRTNEASRSSQDNGRYSDVMMLADYALTLQDSGKLETGKVLTEDNYAIPEASTEIQELFSSDWKCYKVTILDDRCVLVQTDVIFQSVKGYLVTAEQYPDTISKKLKVPSSLGYDADQIGISSFAGEYSGKFLYHWYAGL